MVKKKSKKRAPRKVKGGKVKRKKPAKPVVPSKKAKRKKAARRTADKKRSRKKVKTEVVSKVESKKYDPSFPGLIKKLIVELGAINNRGEPSWSKIAEVLGVTNETILQWRKESGPYYHEEFAQACVEAIEAVDTSEVQRGLINVAKPHIVVKRIQELKRTGIKPPPKSWRKADVLAFARIRLGIKLDPELSLVEMRLKIEAECEKGGSEKLVTVREERTEGVVDVTAAKLVKANIGPKNKRWREKIEQVITDEKLSEAECENLRKILADQQK